MLVEDPEEVEKEKFFVKRPQQDTRDVFRPRKLLTK